jgi:hypothetical protein
VARHHPDGPGTVPDGKRHQFYAGLDHAGWLVIFFMLEGSGPLSMDNYFEKNKERGSHGDRLPG